MQHLFKNILIPVNFTFDAEVAICKALELAASEGVTIHLLFVNTPAVPFLSGFCHKSERIAAKKALTDWKESIENFLPHAKVRRWFYNDRFVQTGIVRKAKELKPDLIVIGKKNNPGWLPFFTTIHPSAIVKSAGSPVLTATPASLHNEIKNIVVPFNDHITASKLEAIAALRNKKYLKIFLVSCNDVKIQGTLRASFLLKTFQWLKQHFVCQVEYAVLDGENWAKAILQFSEKHDADILLLNTGPETKIGWPAKHIPDVISPFSKIQVLTV